MLKIDLENDLYGINNWLLPRENGLLLSDEEISILNDNKINYLEYNSLEDLIKGINNKLKDENIMELENIKKDMEDRI